MLPIMTDCLWWLVFLASIPDVVKAECVYIYVHVVEGVYTVCACRLCVYVRVECVYTCM